MSTTTRQASPTGRLARRPAQDPGTTRAAREPGLLDGRRRRPPARQEVQGLRRSAPLPARRLPALPEHRHRLAAGRRHRHRLFVQHDGQGRRRLHAGVRDARRRRDADDQPRRLRPAARSRSASACESSSSPATAATPCRCSRRPDGAQDDSTCAKVHCRASPSSTPPACAPAPPRCALFADMGARVIKLEIPPGAPGGDDMIGGRDHNRADYENLHRNKESLTLNMKEPEGVAILHELVKNGRRVHRELPARRQVPPGHRSRRAARDQPAAGLRQHLGLRPGRALTPTGRASIRSPRAWAA